MTRSSSHNAAEEQIQIPEVLPVLPLRDTVVYPFIIAPLSVARELSIEAVDQSLAENRMILLTAQRDRDNDEPSGGDLYQAGTVAVIMRMLKLPDGRIRVLVQGVARARIQEFTGTRPFLEARIERIQATDQEEDSIERGALMRSCKELLDRASGLGKSLPSEVMTIAQSLEEPGRLADLTASNLDLKVEEAQEILETLEPMKRLLRAHELLNRELDLLSMQREIDSLARDEMDRTQRESYLRHQMKAIMDELGEGNELAEEIDAYRTKARKLNWSTEVDQEFERQLKRLERMHPDSSEATTLRNYMDWMTGLPWGKSTRDNLDLEEAARILDLEHYGLSEIKDRILEYLSVRKMKKDSRGPILCFVGPPGVGKTSLGRSIARALGRKFVRLSLGGVKDEAEIRGHRRTYVGAMPGRIIQGMHQAGASNPVFVMDEVDKIGQDFRGDPSAALLEVLDPEQNSGFRDHFLGLPYDLSDVMFVATANLLDTIQPAFRDRMEIIRLSGYTEEEKLVIAQRHLLPRQLEAHGLDSSQLEFSENALRAMVAEHTREAGLRNLERLIARVCRKVTRQFAEGRARSVRVIASSLEAFLGPAPITREALQDEDQIGAATGLAWTESGGDVLFVEATTMQGNGKLMLTGQLGDVMKESAQAALSYARTESASLQIPPDYFESRDVHIHVPEGAIPKDGPSAGITMATAMLSAFTGRPIRSKIAMTGEITLRGNVLPVGGIKEKVLAARRSGIHTLVLPEANRKNLQEIPKVLRKDLTIHFVKHVSRVFELVLASEEPSTSAQLSRRDLPVAEAALPRG